MLNVIPQPQKYVTKNIVVNLGQNPVCRISGKTDERIDYLVAKVFECPEIHHDKNDEGYSLSINGAQIPDVDIEQLKNKNDSYFLSIESDSAFVFSWCLQGLFYGIQTLKQLIENNSTSCTIWDWSDIPKRGMYYDLRQTFPKFENLVLYIEKMAEFKANLLIIEYEDKFPFEKYQFLKHKEYAFSDEQLQTILDMAKRSFVEIIPLQQSFGHLEYVLKHKEFRPLRETEDTLGELCPSNQGSFELMKDLISEMAQKHPESEYIHIGCDEVWSLCECDLCGNDSKERTFVFFVNKLIDFARSLGKKPIIWHDMLAHCSDDDIALLDKRVTVMIWIYGGIVVERQVKELTEKFRAYGIDVMGGSAVRCFDANDIQNYPPADLRISNIDQWVNVADSLDISCVISTNWATAFGMGCPYGIFETSLYFMYYSGERYWNKDSDRLTFLTRYLKVFHGIDAPLHCDTLENCTIKDYGMIIPELFDSVTKNKEIAQHYSVLKEYEYSVNFFAARNYVYRYAFFKDDEGEMTSLKTRLKRHIKNLEATRNALRASLELFLPHSMVELYMESRYFVHDFLTVNLYSNILEGDFNK